MKEKTSFITLSGARENNLKIPFLQIPKDALVVITGVSGSGKSSLAFDTIYAEGRRLYLESLSSYAKQFESNIKPNVDAIHGLSPAIAIDQKTTSRNPRSTVATITEIYDYLRVLFVRIGIPHSPATNLPIHKQTSEEILEQILCLPEQTIISISSPISIGQKGEHRKELISLKRHGYKIIRINGIDYSFSDLPLLDKNKQHTLELPLGNITIDGKESTKTALKTMVETALHLSSGIVEVTIASLPDNALSAEYYYPAAVAIERDARTPPLGNLDSTTIAAHQIQPRTVKLGEKLSMSEKFACPISGFSINEIEPRIFSFNSPYGACTKCDGLGVESFFSPALVIPNPDLSVKSGALLPWSNAESRCWSNSQQSSYIQILESLAQQQGIDLAAPFRSLSLEMQATILYGAEEEVEYITDDGVRRNKIKKRFEGIIKYLEDKFEKAESSHSLEELQQYRDIRACSTCSGYRLKQNSLCIKIADRHIGEICFMSINNSLEWFKNLPNSLTSTSNYVAERIIKEITRRLTVLSEIGLGYLTLDRRSTTLSGGESQRIRLATQLGSGLSNVIYVLDEPSIGLHQSDNDNLLKTLKALRDQDNTVIVVEHDEDTMRAADYLIDIGPGAGALGGEVISAGTPDEVAADPKSLTGQYLSGRRCIATPEKRRTITADHKCIEILGAHANNLRNVDVKIPLSVFVVVTGVSGSGKSTFIIDTLYKAAVKAIHGAQALPGGYRAIYGLEQIDKVIEVDQSAIGRTPRSNPATYINAFTMIREWFASLPEAKAMGYNSSRFSFNVKGGRCEACEGDGAIKVEMYFLPDVYVPCEQCNGRRYNSDTLQVTYHGKSIADVLEMTSDEAIKFFSSVPLIRDKLTTLSEVGLGYIKLGQSATTLSGGEAQRIKLAKELARKATGRTLYIFDEPTTGLHSEDISKLMEVLKQLVNANNSVVVIEHNLSVIKTADYVIDFGPRGGDCGGEVVAFGTPEDVASNPNSLTGQYLKSYL